MPKNIYLICPVRRVSPELRRFLDDYVSQLESQGNRVHYPPRDVNQNDETGLALMLNHRDALERSDEVHAYWSQDSEGSVCDLGMTLMARKPLRLINKQEVIDWLSNHPGKSYTRVVYLLDRIREINDAQK